MDYPSLEIHSIDVIEKDSLSVYSMQFIGENEIIFTGVKEIDDIYVYKNLYLLNLKSNKIKQITFSNSVQEIESTIL